MAIYYKYKKDDRKAIYDAAEKWKEKCLLDDESLIWVGENIWTQGNIHRLIERFVNSPDISGESFEQKFEKQLKNESVEVHKLAIEIMFIYYLFPKSIKNETKKNKLKMIAGWQGINIDFNLPIFQALEEGIGATGPFYNRAINSEISYLILFVNALKQKTIQQRNEILNDCALLKEFAENVRKEINKKVQVQNILLHLILPEKFERITSWGHKEKIVKTYQYLIDDNSVVDTDYQLFLIREKLEENYPDGRFDFYLPEIKKKWQDGNPPKRGDGGGNGNKSNIPSVNFHVSEFPDDLVFENEDLLKEQIFTALKNGKHIILTGPPGTGKSKLAKKICDIYQVQSKMVTASANWSTYETIGGYRPNKEGNLCFREGIFLECVKERETNQPKNEWLIIDEINRADIDKAFGTLFSVLTGDEVTLPFQADNGQSIVIKPQGNKNYIEPEDHVYVIPNDWRIIGTMNTIDKASLFELSYAFMRRFAFIPVGIPKKITSELVNQYLKVWGMSTYPNPKALVDIWQLINEYRKVGPAIIKDIARHAQDNDDYTSAIILYVLPQFEGLSLSKIKEFVSRLADETDDVIVKDVLDEFVDDFFNAGGFE